VTSALPRSTEAAGAADPRNYIDSHWPPNPDRTSVTARKLLAVPQVFPLGVRVPALGQSDVLHA